MKFSPLTSDVILLGGFPVVRTTATAIEKYVEQTLDTDRQFALFFANTNLVVKCQHLLEQMLTNSTVIINDGVGLDIASWLIHRKKFPENLAGTDFLPPLLKNVNHKARVFLLGAKPGIAIRAADTLNNSCGVKVVGTANGYEQAQDTEKLISDINQSGANMLFVAMGNPNQEQWILQNMDKLQVNVLVGVGAFLDFLAGDKPRAPRLIRKLRLEWFYRLCIEPGRLMRRYTFDILVFLAICVRARKNTISTSITRY